MNTGARRRVPPANIRLSGLKKKETHNLKKESIIKTTRTNNNERASMGERKKKKKRETKFRPSSIGTILASFFFAFSFFYIDMKKCIYCVYNKVKHVFQLSGCENLIYNSRQSFRRQVIHTRIQKKKKKNRL